MITKNDDAVCRIIPDSEHNQSLPYPIRSEQDEKAAFSYFLARYDNYMKEYEKNSTDKELWDIKADLLALVHSFRSRADQPAISRAECVSMIDVLFCQVVPTSKVI